MKRTGRRIKIQQRLSPIFMKRVMQTGTVLAFVFVLGYGGLWLRDPAHFPIASVNLVGERHHVALDELKIVILPEAQLGFFRLEVSTLQQQLLALPWMKRVGVRRIWPDRLVIQFEEHQPIARWGDKGLISKEGNIFYPAGSVALYEALPQLQGPLGNEAEVWQMYLSINQILAKHQLSISRLELAPRGAWQLSLSNGIKVVLGTHQVLDRINQFLLCYQNTLKTHRPEIAYVDLRYTSGMALGFKRQNGSPAT